MLNGEKMINPKDKATLVNFLTNRAAEKWTQEIDPDSGLVYIKNKNHEFHQYSTVIQDLEFTVRKFYDLIQGIPIGILEIRNNQGLGICIKTIQDEPNSEGLFTFPRIGALYDVKKKEVDEYYNKLKLTEIKEGDKKLDEFLEMISGGKK